MTTISFWWCWLLHIAPCSPFCSICRQRGAGGRPRGALRRGWREGEPPEQRCGSAVGLLKAEPCLQMCAELWICGRPSSGWALSVGAEIGETSPRRGQLLHMRVSEGKQKQERKAELPGGAKGVPKRCRLCSSPTDLSPRGSAWSSAVPSPPLSHPKGKAEPTQTCRPWGKPLRQLTIQKGTSKTQSWTGNGFVLGGDQRSWSRCF